MKLEVILALGLVTGLGMQAAEAKKETRLAPGGKWSPHSMERPRPPVVTPPSWGSDEKPASPPSDAEIIFDGTSLAKWKSDKKDAAGDEAKWKVENGYFQIAPGSGGIRTRERIAGDCQWHIEWATPAEVKGRSQGRGNSGVFIGGFPEIQVLDSFENDTYPDGQAAGLYGHYPPDVNASRPPGKWQTYDIIVERAKVDAAGKLVQKARLTVLHNGVLVHHAREFDNRAPDGDLALQDHGNPGRFRNIWVRKLNTDESRSTPAPAVEKK